MPTLTIQNLRKSYKKNIVVKNVSLEITSGQIVGLLGPNGAGKTTTFYMIVGLIAADHGNILLDKKNLTKTPIHLRAKQGISYLPQEPSIFRKMDVSENIVSILELRNLSKKQIQIELETLLEELNIQHIRKNSAISLSGGERRRVEIARCLANKPKFILLDEPFAGIDPIAVIDIQKIIKYLASNGIGILITDHSVRETLGICNQAYIVNQGEIFAKGTPISLSGGERRRVEIARCLANKPKFILLDEPFAGIDPIAVIDIQKIIKYLASNGIGILITDHSVRETLGICNQAYIVNQGEIFAKGTPNIIAQNQSVKEIYLGENFTL